MGEIVGSLGELEARRVRLEGAVRRQADALGTFRVHPQYADIETECNALTRSIHGLVNGRSADARVLALYQQSIEDERQPAGQDLSAVYEEAGAVLPELVTRHLDDVRQFHHSLVGNRRAFLAAEIRRLDESIGRANDEMARQVERRATLLDILRTHGALSEYAKLQSEHTRALAELRDVERRIDDLRGLDSESATLRIDEQLLQQRAATDLLERRAQREAAIAIFNENSQALYSAPGNLIIEMRGKGFHFDVEIERSGSDGISKMKVFCYDLMLAQLWAGRSASPGFLVHDSTVFDGVDPRQVALALLLADRVSSTMGFQYICALNSDAVPYGEFPEAFALDPFVRLRLTDATPEGCLLGMRF
jgi:uncharacterized protein YydD (DUF2326 family)